MLSKISNFSSLNSEILVGLYFDESQPNSFEFHYYILCYFVYKLVSHKQKRWVQESSRPVACTCTKYISVFEWLSSVSLAQSFIDAIEILQYMYKVVLFVL